MPNPEGVYQEIEVSLDQRLLAVIQSIYDAAVAETRWPAALKALSDFTDSQAATFWVLDGSVNFDSNLMPEYLDYWYRNSSRLCQRRLWRRSGKPVRYDDSRNPARRRALRSMSRVEKSAE